MYCPKCKDHLDEVGVSLAGATYYCNQCEIEWLIEEQEEE